MLNLPSKHSTLSKFRSHTAHPSSPPVPQLPEICSQKHWRDYFLLLTSCQCGFVFTAATCMSKLQPAGRCKGEVPSSTYGPRPYPSLTPTRWSAQPLGFGGSFTASSAFDGDLGISSSIWLPHLWSGVFSCGPWPFNGLSESIIIYLFIYLK